MTEALAAALESNARTIITCGDIEAAKLFIEQFAVDVLLSDLQTAPPFGFDGLELVRFAAENSPETHIIAMTGFGDSGLTAEATRRGARQTLPKPFSVDILETLINENTPR